MLFNVIMKNSKYQNLNMTKMPIINGRLFAPTTGGAGFVFSRDVFEFLMFN